MITVTLIKKFYGCSKDANFKPTKVLLRADANSIRSYTDAEGNGWTMITGATPIFDNNRLVGYEDRHILRQDSDMVVEYEISEQDAAAIDNWN